MKTTVTELENSRARVEAEVAAEDVGVQIQRAARGLAREMRLPGFRKGKAPPSLVVQRLGFASVFEQALQDALPEWYQRAVFESGVVPIGDPEVEVTEAPRAEGEPLASSSRSACARPRCSVSTSASRSRRPGTKCPTK